MGFTITLMVGVLDQGNDLAYNIQLNCRRALAGKSYRRPVAPCCK